MINSNEKGKGADPADPIKTGLKPSEILCRVAACQVNSKLDVAENLGKSGELVDEACSRGAQIVVLPENFAYMGPEKDRVKLAEEVNGAGPIMSWARDLVMKRGCWLLLGGIPERASHEKKCYNTSVLLDPEGKIRALYRKIHLFDLYSEEGPVVVESDSTLAGKRRVIASTPWFIAGMSICYDLRFPELFRGLLARGAQVLFVPAAFTQKTGEAHWDLLVRARAVENLCFVVAANQCSTHFADRASYGHSKIVGPWGEVLACLGGEEGVCVADLNLKDLREARTKLPALSHRRLGLARPGMRKRSRGEPPLGEAPLIRKDEPKPV